MSRGLRWVLVAQAALFVLLPWTGSEQAWGVFASYTVEIADALSGGPSPFDLYDGLVVGPLAMAVLEWPLLAALGRSPWVHILVPLAIGLANTALTFSLVRRLADERAALFAAVLVAFPPPNTWYHQHQGAYYFLGLLLLLVGFRLLEGAGDRVRWAREVTAWAAIFGSIVLAPGGIGPAAAVGAGLWFVRARQHRPVALGALVPAAIGLLIAASPLVYKALIHVPFDGLTPVEAKAVVGQTKPFFLGLTQPWALPGRLLGMLFDQFPHGLHFGLHGLPGLGTAWVLISLGSWYAVFRRRELRLAPLVLVPALALLVGLLTGWFVLAPQPGDEAFPRDARHVVLLTFFLSWLIGLAAARLPGRLGPALVGLLALASVGTQVAALGPSQGVPFRLESRFIQGFFAGPILYEQPQAAARWCRQGPRPLDCMRGVAWAWGHKWGVHDFGLNGVSPEGGPSKSPGILRRACRDLVRVAGRGGDALRQECFFGLGFGFSDQAMRRMDRAQEVCRVLKLTVEEQRACHSGAAWAQAQNFWNRPGVLRRWVDEQAAGRARVDSARGIGILAAMLADDRAWVENQCRRQVPGDLLEDCLVGAESNEPFMPLEAR